MRGQFLRLLRAFVAGQVEPDQEAFEPGPRGYGLGDHRIEGAALPAVEYPDEGEAWHVGVFRCVVASRAAACAGKALAVPYERSSSATRAVQPVWCEAPRPRPVSP